MRKEFAGRGDGEELGRGLVCRGEEREERAHAGLHYVNDEWWNGFEIRWVADSVCLVVERDREAGWISWGEVVGESAGDSI